MAKKILATLDLGSNSFHLLIVVASDHNQIQVIAKHKQQVQLRSGIDESGNLSREVLEKALLCLREFGWIIKEHNAEYVKVIGTYTARKLSDRKKFKTLAKAALGYEVDIIAGEEEARLICVGANWKNQLDNKQILLGSVNKIIAI
ncbi:MAG: hypothetical protein COB50_02170 [Thiotrichales bacterium]|nr:MAG: hypothetical protein COB50_02170 [Thiotrichales bacterium]